MAAVYLKLALNLFLLLATQTLQPVAGQASPAPTPCRGASITAAKIKDGYAFREGLSPPLDPGLARTLNQLHYEGKKSATWANSSLIPFDCKVAAQAADGCSLDNMETYDALYFTSCTIPWTICRCTQAEMSQANTRDPFGMIGSKLRSYVRHVMAFPSPLDGWTDNQNIMFYGSAGSQTIVSNFIHQATHAMDSAIGNFSAQTTWKDAVDKDSCVADQAATASYSEAFAQAMVVHMYAILNNTFTVDTSCMSNQLGILLTLYPHDVLFPKNCDLTTKPPASRVVDKASDDGVIRPLSSPSAAATPQTNSTGTGISSAAIAGIIIGSFAFGILTMFVSYLFWRRRRIAQANSLAAEQYPKVEEYTEGRVNDSMAWDILRDENAAVTASPSHLRQKDRQYQTPPTRRDDSSDAYRSRRSVSIQGTTFTSQSPPSYLAATTSNSGTR